MSAVESLLRRISLGEDSTFGLQKMLFSGRNISSPICDEFADDLAAMANMEGGVVLLGVTSHSRDVLGIPVNHLRSVRAWIGRICSDSIKPPLDVKISNLDLPDSRGVNRCVIKIEVPRSLYLHEGPSGHFRRIGSSRYRFPRQVLARVFQELTQVGVVRFDQTTIPESSLVDLDTELAERFLLNSATRTSLELGKSHLVSDEDGVTRPTVAGILLASPAPTDWMPHAYIQAVSYAGERHDVNYQHHARDCKGPLDHQIFDALAFVRKNMFVRASKDLARVDRPQYSVRAVFEALVNAVAHRDYTMSGARIRLHMFPDRLELFTPGGLANTLTPDTMHLRQYTRNELIVSLLARCKVPEEENLGRSHIMDHRGDGVPIILKQSLQLSGRLPEYTVIDDSELRLIIWAAR